MTTVSLYRPPDVTDIRSIYPFESHWLQVAGGALHYLDEGTGTGPPVVLLHGNPTWSFYYRRLIAALRPTRRVIAPDHLGCGLSEKPQQYSYRLDDHIANIAHLLRSLGIDEIDLVVHDWGGAIGFGVAARRLVRVRRAVVLNTAAFLSPQIPLRIAACKLPLVGDIAIRLANGFARGALAMAVEQPLDPMVRAGYLLPYRSYADRIANLRFVQDIPLNPHHPTWATVAGIDARLALLRDTDMCILWGGKDWCFDDHFLAGWMQRFPHASVQRFDDAGH
ncbi:MAG TPA: alpha/beta fold hydrolase, partial [Roseiflexaceae bacterium]|nr:alpha/beta fold hydrolase [Roseiflexaceae bacterium]